VLESLTLFHVATRMGDREAGTRLKSEAFAHLANAVNRMGAEAGFIGVDQTGPIGPRIHGAAEARFAG
jgi:Mrp family chromosome partitioning ATPase